jgi:hypothetical protein
MIPTLEAFSRQQQLVAESPADVRRAKSRRIGTPPRSSSAVHWRDQHAGMSLEPNGRKHDQAAIHVESGQLEPEHLGVTGCEGRGDPVVPNVRTGAVRSPKEAAASRPSGCQGPEGRRAGPHSPSIRPGSARSNRSIASIMPVRGALPSRGSGRYIASREAHLMTMPDVEAKLNHFVVARGRMSARTSTPPRSTTSPSGTAPSEQVCTRVARRRCPRRRR